MAPAEATVQLRVRQRGLGVRRPDPFADLEALRAAAELPLARFTRLAGIPERTYRRRLAKLRAGDEPVKGPWPTPSVDALEAPAAKYASDWPAWEQRKIAAMMRADGLSVSTSTVERAPRRRGLLLPRGFLGRSQVLRRPAPRGVPRPAHRTQPGLVGRLQRFRGHRRRHRAHLRRHRLRHQVLPRHHHHPDRPRHRRPRVP